MSIFPDPTVAVNLDPSELHADEDYAAWSREYHERIAEERLDADVSPSQMFVQKLFDVANDLLDSDDSDLRGLAEAVAAMAHEARGLDAKSWEQYQDRRDAMIDSRG